MSRIESRYSGLPLDQRMSRRNFFRGGGKLLRDAVVGATVVGGVGTLGWVILESSGDWNRSEDLFGKPIEGWRVGPYVVEPLADHEAIARSGYFASDKYEIGFLKLGTEILGIAWVWGGYYESPQSEFRRQEGNAVYGAWLEATSLNGQGVIIYTKDQGGNLVPKLKDGKPQVVNRFYIAANSVDCIEPSQCPNAPGK